MSTIYVLEPPTKGKVVLKTTMGPLDIELWPKEAPKAVRNFVQLCLEGYYDRTIFHRVIKSFLIQGGDPTGSGTGGESIYGAPFADEFHSRLRFNHRGLVACANAGTPHSNGSQFFITLDRSEWLDKKSTIFGKVTGDSIYNLLRLGEVDTDKDDRPLVPPKILSVEVLWNPFDDIVARQKPQLPSKTDTEVKQEKKKAVKQLNVLSFGEEVEEEEKEAESVKDKIKSIHDVLDDPRFLKEDPQKEQLTEEQVEKKKEAVLSIRDALSSKKNEVGDAVRHDDDLHDDDDDDGDDDGVMFDLKMRSQILKKRRELGDATVRDKPPVDKLKRKAQQKSPPRRKKDSDNSDESDNEVLKAGKLSLKRKGIGSEARVERLAKADSDLQLLNKAEQERQLQKQRKRRHQGREDTTLARLDRFKASLSNKSADTSVSTNKESKGENENDDDLSGWRSTKLQFVRDSSGKNEMARKDDPNDYVVFDPLLEKGKEKFNKMQAKMKRRDREWAGQSLT
ncbi:Peptidyl-prolyl cis-trans isomerase CWC27 [Rhynchospora pubera]|uniref:Peptidyl-prolyl cis-trans isomerase CWC27 n=1 Tax=Rhynchospora pubera TaxID=906938 RepID=A0AAV8G293_9POAL|nr:Peptidyl-prolyl cis-trans isomerase CWC27 [Rhynchospora pubera]